MHLVWFSPMITSTAFLAGRWLLQRLGLVRVAERTNSLNIQLTTSNSLSCSNASVLLMYSCGQAVGYSYCFLRRRLDVLYAAISVGSYYRGGDLSAVVLAIPSVLTVSSD